MIISMIYIQKCFIIFQNKLTVIIPNFLPYDILYLISAAP